MTDKAILLAIMTLSCLLSIGCQKQTPIPLSEGAPNHALDAWIAQDSAQLLCRYSRGAFPSWHLWKSYEHLLKPDEAKAIAFVQKRLEKRVPPGMRPKMRAVARFIAENTVCEIDENSMFKQTDLDGNIQFTFQQTIPRVPNVPPVKMHPQMSPQQMETAWLKTLTEHYDGQTTSKTIQITVEPQNDAPNRYLMRSNIFDSYAAPIQISDFWKKLETWQLDEALELLSIACVQNDEICDEMTAHFEAAVTIQNYAAADFEKNIDVEFTRLTSISLTGNSSYTSAHLQLTNHSSNTYSYILFKTDEVVPQFCTLQSKRTWRDDAPLSLKPGMQAQAWCALAPHTPSNIELHIVMADIHDHDR